MANRQFLFGLLLACAVPASVPVLAEETDADPTAEKSPELVEVELAKDRYERLTVPVVIDGKGPYRFFIDTGAQATVVTSRITEDLSLEPFSRAMLVAMGSSREVDLIAIDRLEFADRTLSGLVSPLLERQHIGADGILGLDTLQDLRVLIDFNEGRMTVADAKALGGNAGYEIIVRARSRLGQMIITDARLNGVKTAVIIDTGAQNSVGNLALYKRLRARAKHKVVTSDVHGTEILSDVAFAKRLEIGPMQLNRIPISFVDSPALDALGYADEPALILGMGNLRMFNRVAIDFPTRRVLFDVPEESIRHDASRLIDGWH
ncbi:aspartyl protease family protein [Qipengyuania vesicularis]|uniref:aspartyl protease family protein n=1 Tax=Qipengyuania vesicularis TaxID=2867232 RepID=UPI001C884E63|nr:aspartyl protease family protein [Qipengyuania vesicularis]MBX7526068.1 aspartyl protease family protein [Qipengyuania vesicularis]